MSELNLPTNFVAPKELMCASEYEYRQMALQQKKLTMMDDLLDVTSLALKRGKVVIDNVESASQLRDFSAAVKNFSDVFSSEKLHGAKSDDKSSHANNQHGAVNINITFDNDKGKASSKIDVLDIEYTEDDIKSDDEEIRF